MSTTYMVIYVAVSIIAVCLFANVSVNHVEFNSFETGKHYDAFEDLNLLQTVLCI